MDRAVSFTKGCYTGQELVARLDARGNKVARTALRRGIEPPDDRDRGVVDAGRCRMFAPGADPEAKALGHADQRRPVPRARRLGALAYAHRSLTGPGVVSPAPEGDLGSVECPGDRVQMVLGPVRPCPNSSGAAPSRALVRPRGPSGDSRAVAIDRCPRGRGRTSPQ